MFFTLSVACDSEGEVWGDAEERSMIETHGGVQVHDIGQRVIAAIVRSLLTELQIWKTAE